MGKRVDTNLLICPECMSDNLNISESSVRCKACQKEYRAKNGKYYFAQLGENEIVDSLDRIKYSIKRFKGLYRFFINVFSPVYIDNHVNKFLKTYIEGKNIVAINLGSGEQDLSPDISNIDIFPYETVDLTCDIERLPLKDNCVDVILNIAVLEHVKNSEEVVKEIYRVLKRNGIVYSTIPFMQGYHASPHDYTRRTYEGMRVLFRDFETIELRNVGGPTSGLLWIMQEWLAIILSFGIKKIYIFVYIFLVALTFPMKFLDIVLANHPMAKNISSAFTYIGRKK